MEYQTPALNEPILFKTLPKEERKALQKEWYATPEGKKLRKTLMIVGLIYVAIVIGLVVLGFATENHGVTYTSTPTTMFFIWPAIISQSRFEEWLLREKNIIIKVKKERKKKS